MTEFLRQVAAAYYGCHGDGVGRFCFVFPSRRSALFFEKYLGECASRPVFLPRVLTINALFQQLSGFRPADRTAMLYRLYLIYAELMWPGGEPRESFDDFICWGDILLNDFDDIDKYMADAARLFANINDLAEIDSGYDYLSEGQRLAIRDFWGSFLASGEPSEGDKRHVFRTIWSVLHNLYTRFRGQLMADGLLYEGGIYRHVAETVKNGGDEARAMLKPLEGYDGIVFVGLNALNNCEKILLDEIKKNFGGDFYWDFEDPVLRDRNNRASLFMEENILRYPSRFTLAPSLPPGRSIKTIAVPSAVAQTRIASEILARLAEEPGFDPFSTAVVLPDENLLLPMLGAIPEKIGQVNVTMGFPLSAGTGMTLLRRLESLLRNRRTAGGTCSFYHRDVTRILEHPCFSADPKVSPLRTVRERAIAGNHIYIPEQIICDALSECDFAPLATIFRSSGFSPLTSWLCGVLEAVQEFLPPLEQEFISQMARIVTRLASLGIPMEERTVFRLIRQLSSVIRIPFEGEPLSGLQIMGPLETRALDFRNVIILSVNEGIFPKLSVSGSFIPYNLRKGFELPNYEFQDAISAYYFYRGIERAENVVLIYDSRTDGLQSGEPSRFINQLKYHFELPVVEESAPFTIAGAGKGRISEIPKGEVLAVELRRRYTSFERAFSASSINRYLDCQMRFYFENILGMVEEDDVEEDIDASSFGNIFHAVMEGIYAPRIGTLITEEVIAGIMKERDLLREMASRAICEQLRTDAVKGRNAITLELILHYVEEALGQDRIHAPFIIEGTESRIRMEFGTRFGPVILKGVIDRTDRLPDGSIRIIDYKTGHVGNRCKYKAVDDVLTPSSKRPEIALQLLLYQLLYTRVHGVAPEKCISSVYDMRGSDGICKMLESAPADLERFATLLKGVIEEILDPAHPFEANPDSDYFGGKCKYCLVKSICDNERHQDN